MQLVSDGICIQPESLSGAHLHRRGISFAISRPFFKICLTCNVEHLYILCRMDAGKLVVSKIKKHFVGLIQ